MQSAPVLSMSLLGTNIAAAGKLFATFGSMSLLLFGGGYVFIPLMQQVVVDGYGWVTRKEFLDGIALGQIMPGPILISSVFIGYKVAGLIGRCCCNSRHVRTACGRHAPLHPVSGPDQALSRGPRGPARHPVRRARHDNSGRSGHCPDSAAPYGLVRHFRRGTGRVAEVQSGNSLDHTGRRGCRRPGLLKGVPMSVTMSVLIPAAEAAGAAILEVYNSDFAVDRKEDRSPLTIADLLSHEILSTRLKKEFPFRF